MSNFVIKKDLASYVFVFLDKGLTRSDIEKARFSPEYERAFTRAYLEELRQLDGENPPTEAEVERLYIMVQKYWLVSPKLNQYSSLRDRARD